MRAGDRTEHRDQDDQNRAGRQRVAEKRERDVLGQRFGHDAGADHGGDENAVPSASAARRRERSNVSISRP